MNPHLIIAILLLVFAVWALAYALLSGGKWRGWAMLVIASCVLLYLSGCSVIASKPVTVACQAADTITTVKVLHAGGVEKGALMNGMGPGGVIAFGVIWLGIKLYIHDDLPKGANAALNVIACGAAVHNASVLRGMK